MQAVTVKQQLLCLKNIVCSSCGLWIVRSRFVTINRKDIGLEELLAGDLTRILLVASQSHIATHGTEERDVCQAFIVRQVLFAEKLK